MFARTIAADGGDPFSYPGARDWLPVTALILLSLSLVATTSYASAPAYIPTLRTETYVGPILSEIAVYLAGNLVYVSYSHNPNNTVYVLSGSSAKVVSTIPLDEIPVGVAIDQGRAMVFVGGRHLVAINAATSSITGEGGSDTGGRVAAVDASNHLILVVDFNDGTIKEVNETSLQVIRTFYVDTAPATLALNPNTHEIYVTYESTNSHEVSVVGEFTGTVLAELTTDGDALSPAVNPVTNMVYVTGGPNSSLSVIDGSRNAVVASISLPEWANAVAVDPATNMAYVTTFAANSNSVMAVNCSSNSYVGGVLVTKVNNGVVYPVANMMGVAVDSSTHMVFASAMDGYVAVIQGFVGPSSQTSTTSTSTTGSGTGESVPEFPAQSLLVCIFAAVIIVSYAVLRQKGGRETGPPLAHCSQSR